MGDDEGHLVVSAGRRAGVIDYRTEDFVSTLRNNPVDFALDTQGGDITTRSLEVVRPILSRRNASSSGWRHANVTPLGTSQRLKLHPPAIKLCVNRYNVSDTARAENCRSQATGSKPLSQ